MVSKLDSKKVLEMSQKTQKQKGASMIEYALVVAAVVALGVVLFGANGNSGTIGTAISGKASTIAGEINGGTGSGTGGTE